jgi:hypothetical protein
VVGALGATGGVLAVTAGRIEEALPALGRVTADVEQDWRDAAGRAWVDRAVQLRRTLDRELDAVLAAGRVVAEVVERLAEEAVRGPDGDPALRAAGPRWVATAGRAPAGRHRVPGRPGRGRRRERAAAAGRGWAAPTRSASTRSGGCGSRSWTGSRRRVVQSRAASSVPATFPSTSSSRPLPPSPHSSRSRNAVTRARVRRRVFPSGLPASSRSLQWLPS